MITYFLIFFSFILGFSHAQIPPGHQFVDFWGGADNATTILEFENHYLIVGRGFSYQPNIPCELKTLALDKQGNILNQRRYGRAYSCMTGSVAGSAFKFDSLVIAIGYIHDTAGVGNNDVDPIFFVLNQYGDTLYTKRWRFYAYRSIIHNGLVSADGNIIFTGILEYPNLQADTWIYKADDSLNMIWSKDLGLPSKDSGSDIVELGDKGFIISSAKDQYSPSQDGRLIKTDSAGNIEWQKYYGTSGEDCGIIELQLNNNYLYGRHCLDTIINPGDHFLPQYIFGSDLLGNMNWRLFFNSTGYVSLWNTKVISDSTILTMGQYSADGIFGPGPDIGFLAKISTSGQLLWQRSYTNGVDSTSFDGWFNDLIITEDDGIFAVGQASGNGLGPNSDFWIMKTDKNGCITPGCDTLLNITTPILTDHLFKIYPNPTSGEINIQIELSEKNTSSSIEIYDISGKLVFRKNYRNWSIRDKVNIPDWSEGIFFAKLIVNDKPISTRKILVVK